MTCSFREFTSPTDVPFLIRTETAKFCRVQRICISSPPSGISLKKKKTRQLLIFRFWGPFPHEQVFRVKICYQNSPRLSFCPYSALQSPLWHRTTICPHKSLHFSHIFNSFHGYRTAWSFHRLLHPSVLLKTSLCHSNTAALNTLRTGSFKLFKRPFPGFLTMLTL